MHGYLGVYCLIHCGSDVLVEILECLVIQVGIHNSFFFQIRVCCLSVILAPMINIHFHNDRHLAHYVIIFMISLLNFFNLFLYDKVHVMAPCLNLIFLPLLTMEYCYLSLGNTVLVFYI